MPEDLAEIKEDMHMRVGVDERSLVIEAMATLAHRKSDMANFILNPAGVPKDIYGPLAYRLDDLTGRRMTKRQAAPLILDALQDRNDYSDIVENIVKIAATWNKFELSDNEYEALAVQAKARVILENHQLFEAEEAARKDAARKELERERSLARKRELDLLLAMFDELALLDEDVQKRGYLLQDLMNRLFDAFEIPVHKSFTRNAGAEQIDGAFQIGGWHYLTECRWRQEPSSTRELDGFSGQISRSGKQTMGLFLSINGWSEHVPGMLKQSTEKAIILMQGYDLRAILSEEVDLREYILAAVKNLNLNAEPYLGVREYLK